MKLIENPGGPCEVDRVCHRLGNYLEGVGAQALEFNGIHGTRRQEAAYRGQRH